MGQSESVETPEPGDLIEISRGFYQHWAVYIGDGLVVHFAAPPEVTAAAASSLMSIAAMKAVVKKEKLIDVVGTNDWKVNNDLDEKYEPHQTDIIVKEALQLVGEEQRYDIVTWNCEHLAKMLRYGKAESLQVRKAEDVMVAGGVAVVGLGMLALVGALSGGSKREDNSDSDGDSDSYGYGYCNDDSDSD
ncbi:phospholipase A and acyltransferase 3-like [Sparus aurata]|uniref:Phospholipase A and acyltransferase 3-like n=1 Tax=Sparus aurata TaxID=8175 RepID=A0A671WPY4_SPAAU|nr:phospholipase A and acyltransferase 3-like [Sparus aurata]